MAQQMAARCHLVSVQRVLGQRLQHAFEDLAAFFSQGRTLMVVLAARQLKWWVGDRLKRRHV